ncbi:DUF3783 domain-containing protein [Clostridium gasigenes]|uniref:DUF3783 domain-containing protein n=1 Tax=Clostridium gasigenes TaxID=94869 RepID=UPI001C0AA4F2|nr:DUF3783 domain-containing protein [Clostridium gasigenes]MBU3108444.1 DUF3783 domain-containing protein [Clostridium gasigenes]
MSFEKIDINNKETVNGRNCIIIYNFNSKELKSIKNYANILGIKDHIILSSKDAESIIKDVLENNLVSNSEDGIKQKALIFNAISPAKMNMFIENLKKIKINNILKAVVTETSKEWTVNTVISNLIAERIAMKTGKEIEHTL